MIRNNDRIPGLFLLALLGGVFLFFGARVLAQAGTVSASVKIAACGNGTIDSGELCDGADVAGNTCRNLGYGSGVLRCTVGCTLDTSGCLAKPVSSVSGGGANEPIKPDLRQSVMGDLDGNGKVDLVDFSIAAYWYGNPLSGPMIETEKRALNGDGVIDLADFSIIAYNWSS